MGKFFPKLLPHSCVEAHSCIQCLYAVALEFPFTGAKRTKAIPVSMKTWFAKFGIEELKCPA